MIIAIDGPSGAGKSTVSKAVARRLGFSCLDTGAMYRSIAWQALQDGVSLEDGEALGRIADTHEIGFSHEPGDPFQMCIRDRVHVGDEQDVALRQVAADLHGVRGGHAHVRPGLRLGGGVDVAQMCIRDSSSPVWTRDG